MLTELSGSRTAPVRDVERSKVLLGYAEGLSISEIQRPIVRGKLNKPVEFGAKLSASLTGDGLARVDHIRWEAFHEGGDLKAQGGRLS